MLYLLAWQLPPNGKQRAAHDCRDGQLFALHFDAALLHNPDQILCFNDQTFKLDLLLRQYISDSIFWCVERFQDSSSSGLAATLTRTCVPCTTLSS